MINYSASEYARYLLDKKNGEFMDNYNLKANLRDLVDNQLLTPRQLVETLSIDVQVNEIPYKHNIALYLSGLGKTVFAVLDNRIISSDDFATLNTDSEIQDGSLYVLSTNVPQRKLSKLLFLQAFMEKRWNTILVLLIIGLPAVIAPAIAELLQQPLFDSLIPEGRIPAILLIGIASILLQTSGQIINSVSSLISSYLTNNIELESKLATAKRFLNADQASIPQKDIGSWRITFSVASSFIESIQSLFISIPIAIVSLIANLLVVGAFTDLSAIWHLFLLMLLPTIVSSIISYISSNYYVKIMAQQSSIETTIYEVVRDIREIWMLGCESIYLNKFSRSRKAMSTNMLSAGLLQSLSSSFNNFFQGALYAYIFFEFYRSTESSSSELSVGALLVMYFAVGTIGGSLASISSDLVDLAQSLPTYWMPNAIRDINSFTRKSYAREKCPTKIILSEAIFLYDDIRAPFPEPINIQFESGSNYALVGPSGSGKTTLLNIIAGQLSLTEGKIEIFDRFDQKIDISLTDCNILYLGQDTSLYGSVLRDILDPTKQFTDKQLYKAISDLDLDETMDSLPLKLKTPINEFNRDLSLGQLQRFKLGRALLTDYDIIMSDEITCHLPEDLHLQAIELLNSRSRIHISSIHRISALSLFDKCITIKGNGEVVEGITS